MILMDGDKLIVQELVTHHTLHLSRIVQELVTQQTLHLSRIVQELVTHHTLNLSYSAGACDTAHPAS